MSSPRHDRALGQPVRRALAVGMLVLLLPASAADAQSGRAFRQPSPMQRCIDQAGIDGAERARPTVTLADAQLAAQRGRLSGYAASCLFMDWNGRNYTPMMAYFRSRGLGERQLAYLSCVHDQVRDQTRDMNNAFAGLRAHARCDQGLVRELAFPTPAGRPARVR